MTIIGLKVEQGIDLYKSKVSMSKIKLVDKLSFIL